jgi:hypothetical protein
LDKLFEAASDLWVGSQQKTAPFEFDLVAVLFFDAAQPNGRVEAPGSQVVGPDDEANGIHETRSPRLFSIQYRTHRIEASPSGFGLPRAFQNIDDRVESTPKVRARLMPPNPENAHS